MGPAVPVGVVLRPEVEDVISYIGRLCLPPRSRPEVEEPEPAQHRVCVRFDCGRALVRGDEFHQELGDSFIGVAVPVNEVKGRGLSTSFGNGGRDCSLAHSAAPPCAPYRAAVVHSTYRMPVILRRDLEGAWMDPANLDPSALAAAFEPYPASEMRAYAVSSKVNTPRYDAPDLIVPAS